MENSKKILICNENAEERRKITETLIRNNYRKIDECSSGDIALEKIAKSSYDVVIVDLWISGVDGIGVIRSSSKICPSKLPAFILTSPVNKQSLLQSTQNAMAKAGLFILMVVEIRLTSMLSSGQKK